MRSKRENKPSVVTADSFSIQLPDFIQDFLSLESLNKEPEVPEVSEESDVHVLPRIIAEAFATVLSSTVNQLDLITNVGELPRLIKEEEKEDDDGDEDDSEKEVDEDEGKKKLKAVPGQIFDTITLEYLDDSLERQKLSKFLRNVKFVRDLLEKTSTSLLHKNSFDVLVDKVRRYKEKIERRSQILEETAEMRKELSDLVKAFNKEKRQALKDIEKMKKETNAMRNSLGLQTVIENTKMHYVQKWEKSRHQLNTLILTRQEDELNNKIDRMRVEIEREEMVNEQVQMFLEELQQDYEKEIESWMERYDREMEQLDFDIQVTNEKIEDQLIANAKIKKKYEDRTQFIEEWLIHREQKRLERERFERITESAITIQCWWRTVMIKKKLGPYGKKKRGKGKGKGKKK